MPTQLSNQQFTKDFVLFAENPHPSVSVNRQTHRQPSTPASSLSGNKYPRSSYDFECTSTPTSTLSTVQHNFDPDIHWLHQEQLAINASLPFGTLPAANMTADHLMTSHLEQAAASAAGLGQGGLQDYLLRNDYQHDSFDFDGLQNTVSPNDLAYNADEFTPALPMNHSFESLATPSLLEDTSPLIDDDLDVSPAYESFNTFTSNTFTPLFGTSETMLPTPKKRKHTEPEISSSTESLNNVGSVEMSRISSTQSDRGLLRQRLSVVHGVSKSTHRQSKPLEPIEVKAGDEVGAKRAKNTMAARKSRQKKKDEVTQLEDQLMQAIEDRDYWKMLAIKHGAPMPTPSPAMSPM